MNHLLIDIGGSWIKYAAFAVDELPRIHAEPALLTRRIRRTPSPRDPESFRAALSSLATECAGARTVSSVTISTTGIVHASGKRLIDCVDRVSFLKESSWIEELESTLACPAILINDAEAFLLGAAEMGYVPRIGTLCSLVIGTGLGCAVCKDGRHWRPQRRPSLLGSIRCAGESFDSLASSSGLAAHDPAHDLKACLENPALATLRDRYFSNLSDIILTASILHGADAILIGGGLVDAAREARFDLGETIRRHWQELPPGLNAWPKLAIAAEGNTLTLIGAAAFAAGNEQAAASHYAYNSLTTEQTNPAATDLHLKPAREILEILWRAEEEAGNNLGGSLDGLAQLVGHIVSQWNSGGRIIYVGAGASGRIGAMDAVEVAGTFGVSPDRVAAVIAGGLNEAALNCESEGEEDYSGVPDMILLQPTPLDTVIGISASGSAAFVRTALHDAQRRGAKTAMLKASGSTGPDPWDWTISLASGIEVIAGSTRMKAGTATKKVLNFLTTTIMARVGRIQGPYMIHMNCINNEKLRARGEKILRDLFPLSEMEAGTLLAQNDFQLDRAIEAAQSGERTK